MSVLAEKAETKGSNLLGAVDMLRQYFDPKEIDLFLNMLPGDVGQRLSSGTVLRSGWYPVEYYAILLQEAEKKFSSSLGLLRRIGHDLVARDMRGIYSILVKMISPEMLLSWGPRTFGQYYRGGKLEVDNVAHGITVAQYKNWHGFTMPIWLTVAGGVEAALQACGAKNVRTEIAEGGKGADARLRMRWTKI